MNELISKLFKQSGGIIEIENGNFWTYTTENYDPELFAKLIVRECIDIVNDAERGGSNEIWDNAVKFIKRDLQEHFGVEE